MRVGAHGKCQLRQHPGVDVQEKWHRAQGELFGPIEVGFYLEEGLDIAERRIVVVAPGFAHPIVGKRPVQLHGDIHREQQRAMVAKELSVPWIGARTGAHALVLTPLPLHLVEVAVCLLGARLARRLLPVLRIEVARIVLVADRLGSSTKQYISGKREVEQNGKRGHPARELVAADAGKRRREIERGDLLIHGGGDDGGRARFCLGGRCGGNAHGG